MSEMVLQFGKHRGKTVAAVADTNPSYLCWLCDHLPDLEDELYSEIQAALQRSGYDPNDPRDFPPCPDPKGGVHFWIMSAGGWCKGHDIPRKKAADMIRENISRDPNPANEIEAALEKIYSESAPAPEQLIVRKSKAPVVDHARRREVVAQNSLSLGDLIASSPLCLDSDPDAAEKVIDGIFPGNPLICVGKAPNLFATRPRETWRGHLSRMAFIVPNVMKARFGTAQDGHQSERCLDNTGPRRFVVIEQDSATPDEQVAVLMDLAEFFPLAVVVFSGRHSLHGWFAVGERPEGRVQQFVDIACQLGADNATRCPCQLVRMPGGTRETGEHQRILYFNPDTLSCPVDGDTSQAFDPNNPARNHVPKAQEADVDEPESKTTGSQGASHTECKDVPHPRRVDDTCHQNIGLHCPLPSDLPPHVAALLSTAPPFGQGLLQWIKPAAIALLPGRDPREVAELLHLVTARYPELTGTEIRSLKSGRPSS
jgi:Exodeoxyribonuclease X-like C-terminal